MFFLFSLERRRRKEKKKKICCGLILNFQFELYALGMYVFVFVCIMPFSCMNKSECLLFGLSFWLSFFSTAVSLSLEAADGLYMDMPNFFCIRIKCEDACLFVVAYFKIIMSNMKLLLAMVFAKILHALYMNSCVTTIPCLFTKSENENARNPTESFEKALFFPSSFSQQYCGSFVVCYLFSG